MHRLAFSVFCFLTLVCTAFLAAADWNQFRGPSTNGETTGAKPPIEWSADKNVRWKSPLPRPGNGSPIVSGNHVFVTSALDEQGKQRSLLAFERKSGKQLWVKTVEYHEESPTHPTNPYCGTTPASDGERVVVWHASAGLYCYDHSGDELWSRKLGQFEHMWGYGGSPILVNGRIYLNCSPSKTRTFVTAMNLQTGETIWETDEPMDGNGEVNTAQQYMGSWATPIVATVSGKQQLIVAHPTRLVGYDLDSGDILWWCEGIRGERGDLAYSSPLCDGEVCVTIGGYNGPAIGVQLGGSGDITNQRLWRTPQNPQSIGSGILREGVFCIPHADGTIECLQAKTGKRLWEGRAGAPHWGSITAAGELMYVTNQSGETTVFRFNSNKFEKVAVNPLPGGSNSTPAIVDDEIFIRTMEAVYCIGE